MKQKKIIYLLNYYEQRENEQNIQRLEEEVAKIRQENDDGTRKIDELQNDRTELKKQKEHYAELSSIANDMEKELHDNKAKARELTIKLQHRTKENDEKVFTDIHFIEHGIADKSSVLLFVSRYVFMHVCEAKIKICVIDFLRMK